MHVWKLNRTNRSYARPNLRPLTMLALAALGLASCSIPENVAVTQTPLGMGAVHRATVVNIFPIFVPGGVGRERYPQTGGAAGVLAADVVFEESERLLQLTSLLGNAGTAISGVLDERHRGDFCQYVLSTQDQELLGFTKDRTAPQNDDERNRILQSDLNSLQFESQRLSSSFQSANFEFTAANRQLGQYAEAAKSNPDIDPSILQRLLTERVNAARRQVEAIEALLVQNAQRIRIIDEKLNAPPSTDSRLVAVNNPCRDFDVGESIYVVSTGRGREFILQKTL